MTYDTVIHLPGDLAADVHRHVPAFWSTRCGPKNKPRFEAARARALDLEHEPRHDGGRMTARSEIDEVTGVETTGHDWDGTQGAEQAAAALVALRSTPASSGPSATGSSTRLGRRSPATPRAISATASAARWPPSSPRQGRAGAPPRQLATTPVAQIKKNPDLLDFAMRGGAAQFSRQLRALPRPRRAGLRRLSQPQRRRLALGRLDRHDPQDHQLRHPLRPRGDARHGDAALRYRPAARRQSDRGRGRLRAVAVRPGGDAAAVDRGHKIFAEQCSACHGEDGKGTQEQGAPNLTDGIWLYGNRKADIVETIRTGRGGMMPAWDGRWTP